MTQLIERNNIDVPYFARNFVGPNGHCHTMQFKGNDCHYLVSRIKYFPYVYDFNTHYDIL